MTLTDLIPTLRTSLPRRSDAAWPTSALARHGDLLLQGTSLVEVATRAGTPAQVLDTGELLDRAREQVLAFRRALPGVTIAHRAEDLLTIPVARRLAAEGLALIVRSGAELTLAADAGFPLERVIADLGGTTPAERAVDLGAGRVVVDDTDGLAALDALVARTGGRPQAALLAVALDGGRGTPVAGGAAAAAIRAGRVLRHVDLVGVCAPDVCAPGVCVAGADPATAYATAAERLVALLAAARDDLPAGPAEIVFGGDRRSAAPAVAGALRAALAASCERHALPVPRVTVDRGRSITASAVVTLLRVTAVTRTAARTWVTLDGDLGVNGPAVRLLGRLSGAPEEPVCVADPRTGPATEPCPAGVTRALLPADVRAGDLLATVAVPATPGGPLHHAGNLLDATR